MQNSAFAYAVPMCCGPTLAIVLPCVVTLNGNDVQPTSSVVCSVLAPSDVASSVQQKSDCRVCRASTDPVTPPMPSCTV
jgi:hypothetical protein